MKFYDSTVMRIEENGHSLSLMSLAVSKLSESIFIHLLGTVNSIMLSGYSREAVAISNISNQIVNMFLTLLNMIITGALICMNVELGKKERRGAGEIAGTAVVSAICVSLLISGVVIVFAERLLLLMNVDASMMDLAIKYLRIISMFLPITVLMRCFNNYLISNGYAYCTLIVGIVFNLLNVLFCYAVLYGNVSLPVSGVESVAYAGRLACLFGLMLSFVLFRKKKCPFRLTFLKSYLGKILKIGIPGGMNNFSFTLAQSITTGFVASLGVETFTTKVYISSVIVFSSSISFAIAQGGAVLTGRYRGLRQYSNIDVLYRQNIVLAVICNVIVSAVIYAFHVPLIGMFTNDPAVIAFAGKIMLIDIAVQIFRAINQVSDQALNANGDVKTTLMVSTCACWLFSVLGSYVFGIKLGLGLVGVWIAFALDEGFKATLYLIRWKNGNWRRIEF